MLLLEHQNIILKIVLFKTKFNRVQINENTLPESVNPQTEVNRDSHVCTRVQDTTHYNISTHITSLTLHITSRTLHITSRTLHITSRTLYITSRTLHITSRTLYITSRTLYITSRTIPVSFYTVSITVGPVNKNIMNVVFLHFRYTNCSCVTFSADRRQQFRQVTNETKK
jgi:hypothetical protein